MKIEDYALIGDTQAAALVGRDGSIDWLCLPRFDSGACFAALLGDRQNGRWQIAPAGGVRRVERRYRPGTLVLETTFHTDDGVVRVTDCMPVRGEAPDVVRVVEGVSGAVPMAMDLVVRFDYGSSVPWVRREGGCLVFVAGPDALELSSRVDVVAGPEGDMSSAAHWTARPGERQPFVLTWHPSTGDKPVRADPDNAVNDTAAWWRNWSDRCAGGGEWHELVKRSLITLKALTYAPTGGIVAAPTTSLPEEIGGVRNWDYRFCWLRDAAFTLQALLAAGYESEAVAWRDWLLRAVAGDPAQMQIMYGVAGERRLPEVELGFLAGYEGSKPVRCGNAAAEQLQLDIYGEVIDALQHARSHGLDGDQGEAWEVQRVVLDWLEGGWREPDYGLWEVRGEARHFTHSKVLCWVAFDRAVAAVERFGLDGPVDRWRARRDEVHAEVCEKAWDPERATFTQCYGSQHLDASLLLLPAVGFLEPDDDRLRSTVDAVRRELESGGLVHRYLTGDGDDVALDGLPGSEGAFLICSFWLADALFMTGRADEARALFQRLAGLVNDVGLLAEQYDPVADRMLGNFPQAFSHVGLVNTALELSDGNAAASRRWSRR